MRISETLELSVPDDMDVNQLERYLAREIKKFGKQVVGGELAFLTVGVVYCNPTG